CALFVSSYIGLPTHSFHLSLHDALPIYSGQYHPDGISAGNLGRRVKQNINRGPMPIHRLTIIEAHDIVSSGARQLHMCNTTRCKDRKSTRLNSSHVKTSYAVFCLKKKKE